MSCPCRCGGYRLSGADEIRWTVSDGSHSAFSCPYDPLKDPYDAEYELEKDD